MKNFSCITHDSKSVQLRLLLMTIACRSMTLIGQSVVILPPPDLDNNFEIVSPWQGVIHNRSGQVLQLRFGLEVILSGEKLLSISTQGVWVEAGSQDMSFLDIISVETVYHWDTIPAGSYTICTIAYDQVSGVALNRSCRSMFIKEEITKVSTGSQYPQYKNFPKRWGQGSTIRITNQVGELVYPQSRMPAEYYQIQGNIPVTIHEIPISLTINYASFRDSGQNLANVFQLHFDRNLLASKAVESSMSETKGVIDDASRRMFFWQDTIISEDVIRKKIASIPYYQEKIESDFYKSIEEEKVYFKQKYGLVDFENRYAIDHLKDSLYTTNWIEYNRLNRFAGCWETYEKIKKEYQSLQSLKNLWEKKLLMAEIKGEEVRSVVKTKYQPQVQQFQIGTAYPHFSTLSLDGVILQGIYTTTKIGSWELSFAGGRWVQPWSRTDSIKAQSIISGPILVGARFRYNAKKEGFVGVNFVQVWDKRTIQKPIGSYEKNTYQLVSLDIGTSFLNKKGMITGEWAILPNFAYLVNETTFISQAGRISLEYQPVGNVRFVGHYSKKDENFALLTNPFLFLPEEQYRAEVRTGFFKGNLDFSSFVQKDQFASYTSGALRDYETFTFGSNLRASVADMGFIGVQYAPVFISRFPTDTIAAHDKNNMMLSSFCSIGINIRNLLYFHTELSASLQQVKDTIGFGYVPMVSWHQSVSYNRRLNLDISTSYLGEEYLKNQDRQLQIKTQLKGGVTQNVALSGMFEEILNEVKTVILVGQS
ncbi:MAG: hypothetical protein SF053_19965 [Bacteroidia bacterium]|nr:hypothetical protein [Bacteroidia bacterium]